MLEDDQRKNFIELWNEFEKQKTKEAKFAAVFDKLEPLIQNYVMEGYAWIKYSITYDMIIKKNKHIGNGSKEIWEFVLKILEKAVEKGYLKKL